MTEQRVILLIEDDRDIASAMKMTLEAQNLQVILVYNPEDGLQEAKKNIPDLIILDVMFGEKEETQGFDYALKMKQDKTLAPIPILMVTAVNTRYPRFNFSPMTDGEYLPVDEFIDKPAQPDELVQKVERLLKQKVSKWADWPNPESST